ncbi:MAG: PilW family protein [Sedimenticola sp.]|nr:PilW family protein [Sedimenticola sp.]
MSAIKRNRRDAGCLNRVRSKGVGLVEIMVSLAIGLVLMAGIIQIYLSSKQTNTAAEDIARMQENLRFAAELITNDIRMAGFMPCRQTNKTVNVLNSTAGVGGDFFTQGINGYDGNITDDDTGSDDRGIAGIAALGSPFTNHVAGTDMVSILRGGDADFSIVQHVPTSAQFKLDALSTLNDGDIVMICDLVQASILQITNTNSSNVTAVHNTGVAGVTPGNCTKGLGYPKDCTTTNGTAYSYGPDSHLIKFDSWHYYIGTNNSGMRSLYRAGLVNTSGAVSMASQELVQNIENMQLLYGVDADEDGNAERYVRADQVLDVSGATWNQVVSVRLGILAQTPREIATATDSKTYSLAGSGFSPAATDRRQRYAYNTTVKIRNRGKL